MVKKVFLLILVLLLTGCQAAPSGKPATQSTAAEAVTESLTVFADASLTEAFTALGKAYGESHPQVKITFNFAGAQQLLEQMTQGAGADLFASAGKAQMDGAVQGGLVEAEAVRPLAENELAVVVPKNNPGSVLEMAGLARPGVRLVLAASQEPSGQYALQLLDKATASGKLGSTYKDDVLKNVVSYEQSVREVLNKVSLGEADAGIVYITDVTPTMFPKIGLMVIPVEYNVNAQYFIAPLKGSSRAASDFIAYILSGAGQDILSKFGFRAVQ